MPLSRLENFLINTDGNILYVNPSDLDATDSFDNKGNSLTRPFKTIQRALIEAARFSYQVGPSNDRFDRTTILLYPGTHLIDNRRGLFVRKQPGNSSIVEFFDQNENNVTGSTNLTLNQGTQFDIQNAANVLHKFNSVEGGVIVPKGTSIVGLDLRKTKIRPLYVPDPADQTVDRSAVFRITGGCYFWQFSLFDADRDVFFNNDYGQKRNPSYSHHKLTCFEYADGVNIKNVDGASTNFTDLQMYYFKLMNAYGADTGNRQITDFPTANDFEPNSPEFKIVGDLTANDFNITELRSIGKQAIVTTEFPHGLRKDDAFRIVGVGGSALYEGSFKVGTATSERQFSYTLPADPNQDNITMGAGTEKVIIESDNVTGASPYIFNISLRSIFGMCGMHADGNKATGFKSMVVAQFTGIGLQKDPDAFLIYDKSSGEYKTNDTAPSNEIRPLHINQNAVYAPGYESFHVKASNDSVIQAVSVFAIGFADHFLAEDGADQSITNSNSNFGAKSLVSKGFRKESFNRDDTGYITHIVPPKDLQEPTANVSWRALDPTKTAGVGVTSKLYLLGETDEGNPPSNISDGYKIGANHNEILYLDVVTDPSTGITTTFSAPILMEVPSGAVDGPQAKKVFTVSRTSNVNDINTSTNVFSLTANHNLANGESIRIFSDNGRLPDGIEPDGKYYAIVGGTLAADEIKIASTLNNALKGSAVDIFNTNGGIIRIESRVTDKIPGDAGHPIQYDSTNQQWFITSSNVTTTNKIYDAFDNFTSIIAANNASSYVQRVPENRDLSNRIYKLRYVVPKEFKTAKAPTKNFVLQESKTVSTEKDFIINNVTVERNPRTIANVSVSGATVTITSEKPHKINVGDRVRLKNILSTLNSEGKDDVGFNGYFDVFDVSSTKEFKVSNAGIGTDVYFDNIHSIRSSNDFAKLPVFERNEYKTTFIIQDVETVQEYSDSVQDGIYYLTVLRSDITPLQNDGTTNPFSGREYKQDFQSLYPVVDRDNANNDPEQSISVASNSLLGKVSVDDIGNSITKEAVIEYTKDTKVGLAVTGVRPLTSNSFQIEFAQNHGLNRITGLTLNVGGANYAGSGTTTVYNVGLTGGTGTGADATANLTVVDGVVTGVTLVDGGSAYGVGNTMSIAGGDGNGVVGVTSISRDDLGTVQLVGVGTVGNRKASGYNGVWKIASSPLTANTLAVLETGSGTLGVHTASNGVAIIGNLTTNISSIVGITTTLAGIVTVTTTSSHGLSVGNKIRIFDVNDDTENAHNGDHIVQKIIGVNEFTIETTPGISWNTGTNNSGTGARVVKYSLGATGEDSSLQSEKVGGSLFNFSNSYVSTITGSIDASNTQVFCALSSQQDESISVGDYIQIGDEIMRVTTKSLASSPARLELIVLRGVLGTQSRAHIVGSIVKSIKVIPSEVRRFSSIRASGHTFEYIGYGPGNYSTALPQRIQRTLTSEEERLATYCEKKGGVTFFSGMNDRGEFFTWDGRVKPVERYISEVGNDFTGIFDDLYVRNTLRVGGGPNRNLPSEFRGPVNFTNKITNTDIIGGINAIKLQLKGNIKANPFFQVGPDAKPSLVVNQSTQNVGIQTADPQFELDVNGTIRANVYENFKLSDLPNTKADETTFERNRILKVNEQGDGYELVDVNTLARYTLSSYKISNDGTVHVGTGDTVGGKLQISGIGTDTFMVGQKVKMFGVGITTMPVTVPNLPTTPILTKVGSSATSRRYRYWAAQYHLRTGDVGNLVQCTPTTGIGHTTIDDFNDIEHISLTLSRTDTTNYGVLIYRQESANDSGNGNLDDARLVGILGPKELGNSDSGIVYKDFGVYDQTAWNNNSNKNEYLGIGETTISPQIHFPTSFTTSTVGKRRGWNIDEIVSIGNSSITVNRAYDFNDSSGFNGDKTVKVVADNTFGFTQAINDISGRGGDYLEIPSGVFLASKVNLPSNFTIRGMGKNSILKQQFFANDETDGAGNVLQNNNIFLGVTGTSSKDITLSDITIDGNNNNQYRFPDTANEDSYMVSLRGLSSGLIRGIELRNSSMNGMTVKDSTRVSIENSTFVDGSLTDRYPYEPLNASETTSLRINDCLFENYPGAVDVSSSSVVAVGGNIIRNCGRGLKTFSTGKVTTTNNILLGPADEFIPSPDIFDSDFNGINITVDTSGDFEGPVLQYVEEGEAKDISSGKVTISSAGIGTIVNEGQTNETLGTKFLNFSIITPDVNDDAIDRENGYIQTKLTAAQTDTLKPYIGVGQTGLGYSIVAQEFMEIPTGFSTSIGISTAAWFKNGSAFIGAGATEYRVTLADANQFAGISTGDIVKLVDHSVTPSLSAKILTVTGKDPVSAVEKIVILSGFTTTSQNNGNASGYISIRKQFVIAKGRVGVI